MSISVFNYLKSILWIVVGLICLSTSWAQDPLFRDISETVGMDAMTINPRMGVAWGDYNDDGLMDVFVATQPKDCLFQNLGQNKFQDRAEFFGMQDSSEEASVGVWGDYDADGDLDLFVGNLAPSRGDNNINSGVVYNRLYRNDGNSFLDVAAVAGVAGDIQNVTGGTTSASWTDYDNDGWIDLLVCNRIFGCFLYKNRQDGSFVAVAEEAGLRPPPGMGMAIPYEHGVWADYDRDGDVDLFLSAGGSMMSGSMTPPSSNKLFRNNGDRTFSDVTQSAGLIFETNGARSHTAVWGDYNNDGYPDLFSGNRGSVAANTLAPSKLYRNNRDGTFTDVTQAAGINEEVYVFGADWADVDNDGFLDLYIAIHPDMRDYPDHATHPTRLPHPLYIAQGDGTFVNINEDILDLEYLSGITDLSHQGGAAFADSDNDGDLDLIVVEAMGYGPLRFYENSQAGKGGNWIEIELRSHSANTRAIGAVIEVEANGQILSRIVGFSAAGFASQMPYEQHFGLGDADVVGIVVTWPEGQQERFDSLSVNQKHRLWQSASPVQDWRLF